MEYDYLPGRPVTLGAMYDERSVTSFQALTFISSNEKKKERERERENVQYRDASLNIFLSGWGIYDGLWFRIDTPYSFSICPIVCVGVFWRRNFT